jgi:dynein light chain Tctex-type 1
MTASTQDPTLETWTTEEIEKVISEEVAELLKEATWDESQTAHWNNAIGENIIARLAEVRRPFKYAVDVCVMQKTGAGLHSATSTFFDVQSDLAVSYLWPKEKTKDTMNKALVCLVTVFASSM